MDGWAKCLYGWFFIFIIDIFLFLFCFSFFFFFSFYCLILSSCKWEKFWHFKVALNIFYFAFRLARNSFVFWVSGALVTQDELTLPSYQASLSSWMHPFWGLDWRFRLYCSIPITFCVITRESLKPFGCFICFGIPVEGRFFNFLVDWVMVDLEKAAVHCDSPVSESGLGIGWGSKMTGNVSCHP